jgi:thioredoxin 1
MVQPLEITDDSFDGQVLKSDLPVLVEMWAGWCSPCRDLSAVVKKIAESHSHLVKAVKLDVDYNYLVVSRWRVDEIPAILLFKNGREVDRVTGNLDQEELLEWLAPHLHHSQV